MLFILHWETFCLLPAAQLTLGGSGGLVLHAEAGARGEARVAAAPEAPQHREIKGLNNIFGFKDFLRQDTSRQIFRILCSFLEHS